MEFVKTAAPVLCRHAPESGKGEGRSQIAQAYVGMAITFAPQRKNGVGARIYLAAYSAREVHAEEWKARIRHRIDECSNQRRAFWD